MVHGDPGDDLDETAVSKAAQELLVAAGRPEGYPLTSEYEREAWRVAVRRTVRAYLEALTR